MDYIAPSMECVKPTMVGSTGTGQTLVGRHEPSTQARVETKAVEVPVQAVKITLQDCLACSGCVTTAETILVEAQSRRELCDCLGVPVPARIEENAKKEEHCVEKKREPSPVEPFGGVKVAADSEKQAESAQTRSTESIMVRRRRPVLVTVSEQSAASLAAYSGLSLTEALSMVSGFVRAMLGGDVSERETDERNDSGDEGRDDGARLVYVSDLRWALDLSAQLTALEYQRRVQAATEAGSNSGQLPMLVSACPGWVCYCEKQGSALLPLLCPVLSPQGIAGSLAKRCLDENLYHVSIQPCFDRKLEAARDGYMPADTISPSAREGVSRGALREGHTTTTIPYTDCVLSTAELLEWMLEIDASLPWRAPLDSSLNTDHNAGVMRTEGMPSAEVDMVAHMSSSGGYHRRAMEAVAAAAQAAATAATTTAATPWSITYEAKRNRNHQIATCPAIPSDGSGVKHCFCAAYGFQQIQNIVRGIKKDLPAARHYTFIELMACPEGCLNGGGQVRASQEPLAQATQLAKVQGAFREFLFPLHREKGSDEENGSGDEQSVFSDAAVRRMVASVGPKAFECVFRDRQKEFEESLNQGNLHSLKW